MLVPDRTPNEHESLRRSLEELLKLMLVIWCKENQAIKLVSGKPNADTDKTIVIQRQDGQFGFRMHGSKPTLVSAIESDTPAESSGLEVGDAILSINGAHVLDKSHSDVIKLAKAAGDTLVLEVIKTCTIMNPVKIEVLEEEEESLYCGYLWKLAGYASGLPSGKWLRRWFTLKTDNCLYHYKTDSDNVPVGAVLLLNYEVVKIVDENCDTFRFDLSKVDAPILHLAADTEDGAIRWIDALTNIIESSQIEDARVEQMKWNRLLAPQAIVDPHCFGYLTKLGPNASNRRYCVLKDDCLYFYYDIKSQNAFGVACLAGYTVQKSTHTSQNFSFRVSPADLGKKDFHFGAESEEDKRRWISALEYSIEPP